MGKTTIKKILPLIGGVLFLMLVAVFIQNVGESVTEKDNEKIGDDTVAPNFTTTTLDGAEVRLADYKGKPVLINFWASWCGPCRDEMPLIQEAYEVYKDQGFEVLAINFREKEEAIRKYLDENPSFDFPVLLDDGTINDQYQVNALPTTFFINSDGIIESYFPAELSEEALHVFIQEILPVSENQ